MTLPRVFTEVRRDDLAARSAAFPGAIWLSWSDEFRTRLAAAREIGAAEPELVHLSRKQDYAYTFSTTKLLVPSLPQPLVDLVAELAAHDPGHRVHFLTGLDIHDTGWSLHAVFALLRAVLARSEDWAALYAPLSTTGDKAGEFPLHADLYPPEVICNVFERVPDDGSGASIFLSVERFLTIVDDTHEVPTAVQKRLRQVLTEPLAGDAYTEFFDLVHNDDHPWSPQLARSLRQEQLRLWLGPNEGYWVHDRRFLHGREAPTGGVPEDRLRRLIYAVKPAAAGSAAI